MTQEAPPTLLYLVKQLEQVIRARLEDILRPDRLTALQYTALTVLERRPDTSSAQLARNSFVTAQAMSDIVTALVGRGLIDRQRHPEDRRRMALVLTSAGRALLDRYRPAVADLEAEMVAELAPGQAGDLRELIVTCRQTLGRGNPR